MRTVNSQSRGAAKKPAPGAHRRRDAAATRAALIAAAADILRRDGYFATDSNAIARAAGYAPASFYKHFADKAEILIAVYAHYREIEWGMLRAAAQGASPRMRVRACLRALVRLHGAWARLRADLRAVAALSAPVAAALAEARAPQIASMAALTGLDAKRDLAKLLLIGAIAQTLSEVARDGRRLRASQRALLAAAERAIAALL